MASKHKSKVVLDGDDNAARLLLHRSTIVVRSALLAATDRDPPCDDSTRHASARDLRRRESRRRISDCREAHRALLERHLVGLRSRFEQLAGTAPPESFPSRGGRPPTTGPAHDEGGAPDDLRSDIRRTEWAVYGLERILKTYAERAEASAGLVRSVADELSAWATSARGVA